MPPVLTPGLQKLRASLGGIRAWPGAAWRAEGGVSAVEFALFAPVLFFGLVATADIGLALYERMTMDHVLRAGAQSAMADQGEEKVLSVLKATAAKNFVLSGPDGAASEGSLTFSVERYCTCSDNTTVAVDCSTTCPGSASTYMYYRLGAAMVYDGMILPEISFSPSLQVQIQ